MSSTLYFNTANLNNGTGSINSVLLNLTFDFITLANSFDAQAIQPMPIIETSLFKTLIENNNFYVKPKTGFCAAYNENILLTLDSDQKANSKCSLIGM